MRKVFSGTFNFFISCIAAGFVFCLAAAVAANPEVFSSGELVTYDETDGVLHFFGEAYFLDANTVSIVASLPKASLDFICGFLPKTAITAMRSFAHAMSEHFADFLDYAADMLGKVIWMGS